MLETAMAPHSSSLAWKIPWMEEPGRLQSTGLQRVRHDWAPSLSLFTFMHWRRKWQCSCLENPRDGGAWWAAVSWVAQSRTRLKRLSSSSSSNKKCCWKQGQYIHVTCACTTSNIHLENRTLKYIFAGLPWWLSDKESACQCRRHGFNASLGRSHIPWSN